MQLQQVIPTLPELRRLIQEACSALAKLDADRLEELALSCRALNQSPAHAVPANADPACAELSVLSNVLRATRANRDVLERLLRLRQAPPASDPRSASPSAARRQHPYGDN